jgi:four helix bundle protein
MFTFEKLDVWQAARAFAGGIYDVKDGFPKKDQFALAQQLTRAAVSIAANIAEGSSRSSRKEFWRYVEMAFGSLCKVVAELFIARDRKYVAEADFGSLYTQAERLGRMLSGFRTHLETSWRKVHPHEDDHQTINPSSRQTGER